MPYDADEDRNMVDLCNTDTKTGETNMTLLKNKILINCVVHMFRTEMAMAT